MARSLRQDSKGVAAVEFALVAPVMLVLLLGVVEFGRLMWVRANLQFAAEQATRYAIAHTTAATSEITAQATDALEGSVDLSAVTFTVTNTASSVSVQLSYTFSFVVTGLLPYGPIVLKGESTFPKN